MTPSEKVAYLKGLVEGMEFDLDSKEGKILSVIMDVLGDLALDVGDIDDTVSEICDELDDIEDILFEDDEEPCCPGHHDCCDCDEDDFDYYDEDEEPVFYEVTCPSCNETITIDEDVLELGAIACPNCGEEMEFDLENIEDFDDEEEIEE